MTEPDSSNSNPQPYPHVNLGASQSPYSKLLRHADATHDRVAPLPPEKRMPQRRPHNVRAPGGGVRPYEPPPPPPVNEHGERICGAKTRGGEICGAVRLMTNGRCRHHGGRAPSGYASPNFKHGKYSRILPVRLAAAYSAALADDNRLALNDQIALLDARIEELLGDIDLVGSAAAWREAHQAMVDFMTAYDSKYSKGMAEAITTLRGIIDRGKADFATWEGVYRVIDQRRKLVETEQKRIALAQESLSPTQAMNFVAALGRIIKDHVTDARTLTAIENDIVRLIGPATPALPKP